MNTFIFLKNWTDLLRQEIIDHRLFDDSNPLLERIMLSLGFTSVRNFISLSIIRILDNWQKLKQVTALEKINVMFPEFTFELAKLSKEEKDELSRFMRQMLFLIVNLDPHRLFSKFSFKQIDLLMFEMKIYEEWTIDVQPEEEGVLSAKQINTIERPHLTQHIQKRIKKRRLTFNPELTGVQCGSIKHRLIRYFLEENIEILFTDAHEESKLTLLKDKVEFAYIIGKLAEAKVFINRGSFKICERFIIDKSGSKLKNLRQGFYYAKKKKSFKGVDLWIKNFEFTDPK